MSVASPSVPGKPGDRLLSMLSLVDHQSRRHDSFGSAGLAGRRCQAVDGDGVPVRVQGTC